MVEPHIQHGVEFDAKPQWPKIIIIIIGFKPRKRKLLLYFFINAIRLLLLLFKTTRSRCPISVGGKINSNTFFDFHLSLFYFNLDMNPCVHLVHTNYIKYKPNQSILDNCINLCPHNYLMITYQLFVNWISLHKIFVLYQKNKIFVEKNPFYLESLLQSHVSVKAVLLFSFTVVKKEKHGHKRTIRRGCNGVVWSM